jgi:hypothetical protein
MGAAALRLVLVAQKGGDRKSVTAVAQGLEHRGIALDRHVRQR